MRKWARISTGLAVMLLSVSIVFGLTYGANATQGQPVIAGVTNTETAPTLFADGQFCQGLNQEGLVSCGGRVGLSATGLGYGTYSVAAGDGSGAVGMGVYGEGPEFGVSGTSLNNMGVSGLGPIAGVQGRPLGDAPGFGPGNGVWGHTQGTGSGVYGETGGTGNGVLGYAPTATAVKGQTDSGTGVLATATTGTALSVSGKTQFSRSGTATIIGSSTTPKASIVVNNVALTNKSLVMVTPQKNVAGVWVQAAVPAVANSRFTIFLNKTVTVSYPIAWFVIEKP